MGVVVQVTSEASTVLTGTLTFGSAVVTGLSSTAALVVGQFVQGTGVPSDTLVSSIDSPTQVTLTSNAQANGATSLSFMQEPVTLARAKSQLRVDITDDDVLIAYKLSAARRVCETYVKRAFLPTVFTAFWDSFPFGGGYYNRMLRQFYGAFPGASGATFPGFLPTNTGIIQLPRADLRSVGSINYLDSNGNPQTLDPSNYVVETGAPGRIGPSVGKIWPVTYPEIAAVNVVFTAGYSSVQAVPSCAGEAILLLLTHMYENRGEQSVEMPAAIAALLSPLDWGGYA